MRIDFNQTRADYAAFRASFPSSLFDRLARFEIGMNGQRILDLGAGTGLFSDQLVARGCEVIHLDPSADLLRECDASARIVARAEAIPFPGDSYDVVTAAQCWHWFDRNLAPSEILRVLRAGGRLAVVYQMYIPMPGSVAEATENLILKHRPRWRHANSVGINGQVLRDVQAAGFVGIESFSFDVELPFTRDTWRGFIRTTSPVGASMSPDQLEVFDREHEHLLHGWPETLNVPHRLFAAIARKPII